MKKNLMMILAAVATSAILPFSAWGFTYMSGSGTETDPYKVGSAEALAEMSAYFADPGKTTTYIKITQSFTAGNYTPPMIGNQGSNTQLAGHTVYIYADENVVISGLTVQSAANGGRGLIGYAHENTKLVSIKNITLDDVTINGNGPGDETGAGAFVGCFAGEKLILENCHVQNSTIGNSRNVGGLVGYCNANDYGGDPSLAFNGCSIVDSTLGNSAKPIGGFVGYCLANTVTISNSASSGNTFNPASTDLAGAFVGRFNGDTTNGQLSDVTTTGNKVVVGSDESTEIPLVAIALGESKYEVTNEVVEPTVAVTNSVQSANLFGAVKITGNVASNMYVAVPFEGFESAGAARAASNVVHAANLTAGAKMFAYDKSGDKYNVYEAANGAWTAPTKVTVTAEGKTVVESADLGYGVTAGTGVILQRPNSTGTVYVYGQVPANVASVTFGAGQTLVSPPYTNATDEVSGVKYVNLNAFNWTDVKGTSLHRLVGLQDADYIQFRGMNNEWVRYYYLQGEGWGVAPRQVAAAGVLVQGGKALIPVGTAFWYYSTDGGATVEWK